MVILAAKAHRARQRLEMIFDLSATLAKPDDPERVEYLINLTKQAYHDDGLACGRIIEAITRKR